MNKTDRSPLQRHVLDAAHLERATHGDRALACELLRLFDAQAERLVGLIESATDTKTRRIAAHTLKGAARGVGAFDVAEAAQELEQLADAAWRPALAQLAERVREARKAVAELIAA